MDTTYGILHSTASALGRHGPLLLAVTITLVVIALTFALVAVEAMTAASEATHVAPLRWIARA